MMGTKPQMANAAAVDAKDKLLAPNRCFNIKIKDIKLHEKKVNHMEFSQGPDFDDTKACIAAYQKQVTALSLSKTESLCRGSCRRDASPEEKVHITR